MYMWVASAWAQEAYMPTILDSSPHSAEKLLYMPSASKLTETGNEIILYKNIPIPLDSWHNTYQVY